MVSKNKCTSVCADTVATGAIQEAADYKGDCMNQ